MNDELERSDLGLIGIVEENHEKVISHDSRCPYRGSNQAPLEYTNLTALPLQFTWSETGNSSMELGYLLQFP
jgi:hypothetical protein